MRELAERLLFRLKRRRYDADLDAEMRLHRELRAAKLARQGIPPADAACIADRRFGNKTLLREVSLEMWTWNWIDDLAKDIHHTVRMLSANPLFSAVAVLTLALGIGANTAIFSVANAILLRTMPVDDPRQVFYLHVEPGQPEGASNTGNGNSSFSAGVFEQLRAASSDFAKVMAYVPAGIGKVAVRTGADAEEGMVFMTSGDFFSGLGVAPVCGRTFTLADERQHAPVAVLSSFLGSGVSSRTAMRSDGRSMSREFRSPSSASRRRTSPALKPPPWTCGCHCKNRPELNAWGNSGLSLYAQPTWWCLNLFVRLKPGVDPATATARLHPAFQHAAYEPLGGKPRPGEPARKLAFLPARGVGVSGDDFKQPLYILLAMVGVILVIACANVSMLLAARNTARRERACVSRSAAAARACSASFSPKASCLSSPAPPWAGFSP